MINSNIDNFLSQLVWGTEYTLTGKSATAYIEGEPAENFSIMSLSKAEMIVDVTDYADKYKDLVVLAPARYKLTKIAN